MDLKTLNQKMMDASLRADSIVCLAAAMGDGDEHSDPLTELFNDLDNDELQACFGALPAYVLDCEDIDQLRIEFLSWAVREGKLGFAVLFARPVHTWNTLDSASLSWGYYRTCWRYGDTFEQAIQRGFEWAQREERNEKAALSAKPPAE